MSCISLTGGDYRKHCVRKEPEPPIRLRRQCCDFSSGALGKRAGPGRQGPQVFAILAQHIEPKLLWTVDF